MSSQPVIVRHLHDPSEIEVSRIVALLEAAFEGELFGKFLVGGDKSLIARSFEVFVRAAFIGGEVHIATRESDTEDIIGVAVWYGPQQEAMSTQEQRDAGFTQFMESLPEDLRKWRTEQMRPTMDGLMESTFGLERKLDSWYLHLFAVAPEHQRKGVGRKLIEPGEAQARRDRTPVVLETTTFHNVTFYERLDYEVLGETKIISPLGECPFFVMTKQP